MTISWQVEKEAKKIVEWIEYRTKEATLKRFLDAKFQEVFSDDRWYAYAEITSFKDKSITEDEHEFTIYKISKINYVKWKTEVYRR